MKYQVIFSLKNNEKKYSRLLSAAVVIGIFRVNLTNHLEIAENIHLVSCYSLQ